MRRFAACVAVLFLGSAVTGGAAVAQTPPSWYAGKVVVAGDDHQHPGTLSRNFLVHRFLEDEIAQCTNAHNLGDPLEYYAYDKSVGFNWVVLAHHTHLMTGIEFPASAWPDAYWWWTHESSEIPRTNGFGPLVTTPQLRLPDYGIEGAENDPPWNEAVSFSRAAEKATDPEENFIAFSGREYTPQPFVATGANSEQGGHKVVLLPGITDRICGPPSTTTGQGEFNECDETELYRWVHHEGGVIIQAHPGEWNQLTSEGSTVVWHPDPTQGRRGAITDFFVQGVEVAGAGGIVESWETGYRAALAAGHRLFPSYGSDTHALNAYVTPECQPGGNPHSGIDLTHGAALCWIPSQDGPSQAKILDAMRARNCYYARSHKPELRFEVRPSSLASSSPSLPMGSIVPLGATETLRIIVHAVNDPANQGSLGRRFNRLEILQVPAASLDPLYACGAGASTNCCTQDAAGDHCDVDHTLSNVVNGSYYVRVCEASGGCTAANTRILSAPVFVNWTAYQTSKGINPNCDSDGDGIGCLDDLCWNVQSTNNSDTDGDKVGDVCDVCPTTPDPAQANSYPSGTPDADGDACQEGDTDGDGFPDANDICPADVDPLQLDTDLDTFGDGCDNCPFVENPDQQDLDDDAIGDACEDSDDDGVSNRDDNCLETPNAAPADCDTDEDGYGNACDGDFNQDYSTDGLDFDTWWADFQDGLDTEDVGTDMNCDTYVDPNDWDPWFSQFTGTSKPGPSGLACAGTAHCPDADDDEVVDYQDNCKLLPNAPPLDCDFDQDGYGNACDGDFNYDTYVDEFDQGVIDGHLIDTPDPAPDTDMNCDGYVNQTDANLFTPRKALAKPGPSGIACAGTQPCQP